MVVAALYTVPFLIPKMPLYADAFTPVPPFPTESALVSESEFIVAEEVAVSVETFKFPAIAADPSTPRRNEGEVVPTPTVPPSA